MTPSAYAPYKVDAGKIGDGKIFVWDLEKWVRIRTGEMDGDAL